jgi:ubiquitin carboxyl-terminal hydrolase 14
MAPFKVSIKHAGKTHDVQLDTDLPTAAFKDAIYQVTGVPVDRMKVMAKGTVIKDDTPWKKVSPKEGQTFTVIGAAGELPKPPENPTVFLEDMDDAELAEALAMPVGLRNLGNTCYMNATIQALRAVPELQLALSVPGLPRDEPLPQALRDLYKNMSSTTEIVDPGSFLNVLRQVNPQFAERDRNVKSFSLYAQQDAEECYNQIINSLRSVPGIPSDDAGSGNRVKAFVEQYLMGEIQRTLTCDESPDEPPSVTKEQVLKVECNITSATNYMLSGIMSSLDAKVEKNSPTLGRQAQYNLKSRLTRLPTYLTLHMVRFAWKADIGKKAKIMRKVKFQSEFDALDLATDELKAKLLPVSRRLLEIEKERGERRKTRKKTKVSTVASSSTIPANREVEMADATAPAESTSTAAGATENENKNPDELEDEAVYRGKEIAELESLIHPDLKQDVGSSVSGLYELVAIVTHKGAAADAGHYIGFVKKSIFHAARARPSASSGESSARAAGPSFEIDESGEDWYKFDDDKVSIFPKEKLSTLDGGGEDSSAYVLLYKSKSLA